MTILAPLYVTFEPDERPYNFTFWGGWLFDSPLHPNMLDSNGIDDLPLSDMLEKYRFFIGDEKYRLLLMDYYESHGEDFVVYSFSQKEEQNG